MRYLFILFLAVISSFTFTHCTLSPSRPKPFQKSSAVLSCTQHAEILNQYQQPSIFTQKNDEPYADYDHSNKEELDYDLFRPQNSLEEKLPLILMIHPGGFLTGKKEEPIFKHFIRDFVSEGFACASINYRTISLLDNPVNILTRILEPVAYSEVQIYKSIQDVNTAIRYFKAHHRELNIDPDRIILFGYSAGAILALNHAVLQDDEAISSFEASPENCLSCLAYKGQKGRTTNSDVYGVISISGGVFDLTHIDPEDQTPMLLIHGDEDRMVPYDEGRPFQRFIKDYFFEYADYSIQIPESVSALMVNLLAPRIHGSSQVYEQLSHSARLITVKGSNHSFIQTGNDKTHDCYKQIWEEIDSFTRQIMK